MYRNWYRLQWRKGVMHKKALKFAIAQRKPELAISAVTNYNAAPTLVLEEAIKANQNDIVQLLVDNNADANAGLTYAINNNKNNFIPMMLNKGAKVTPDQIAKVASNGDNVLVKTLIDAGGDKNAALAGAMAAKKYPTAELLVQAGATPDNIVKAAVDNKQKSLLIAALDAGADANPGLAPAINAGMNDYAELLFKAGAKTTDVNLVNAVLNKRDLVLLKLMLDNQTSPDLGMPVAVATNNTDAVKMLLEKNASANTPSLIATAAKNKNIAMIDLLVKTGADPKECNDGSNKIK